MVETGTESVARAGARRRVGLLIVGMHRSGTSALARMISLLGATLPANLMPPDIGNELGHWESNAIAALNEDILQRAGSRWDDWLPFYEGWYDSPVCGEYIDRAREAVNDEFGLSSLFVLKDPRICRLAKFWIDVFKAEAIDPAVIIPIRNPLEVADSLVARDGCDLDFGLLLWLRNVLDAEVSTRGSKRLICTYDQLLDDWATLARKIEEATGLSWPRSMSSADGEISAFIDKDHRHHSRSVNAVFRTGAVPIWVSDAFKVMLDWAEYGESEAGMAVLDTIRVQLDEAGPAFARMVRPGSKFGGGFGADAGARLELEERLEQANQGLADAEALREQITIQGDALAQTRRELELVAAALEVERSTHSEWENRQNETDAERGRLETRASALLLRITEQDEVVGRNREELAALEAALDEQRGVTAKLGTELGAAREAVSGLERHLREMEAARSRLESDSELLLRRVTEQGEALEQRVREVALLELTLNEERGAASSLRAALEAASDQEGRLRETEAARSRLESDSAVLLRRVTEQGEALEQRQAQVEALESALEEQRRVSGKLESELAFEREVVAEQEQRLASASEARVQAETAIASLLERIEEQTRIQTDRHDERTALEAELNAERASRAEQGDLLTVAEAERKRLADVCKDLEGGLADAKRQSAMEVASLTNALHQMEAELEDKSSVATSLANDLANRASALLQRQEEARQAWSEVATERALKDALNREIARLDQHNTRLLDQVGEISQSFATLTIDARGLETRIIASGLGYDNERASRIAAEEALADLRNIIAKQVDGMESRSAEIVQLTALLQQQEQSYRDIDRQYGLLDQELALRLADIDALEDRDRSNRAELARVLEKAASLKQELGRVSSTKAEVERRLGERFSETARLTQALAQQIEQASRWQRQVEWVGQLSEAVKKQPFWWALLPRRWRRKREFKHLRRQGLFDAHAYRARNPDVAAAGIDPLQHYIFHGMSEGRTP